jgi:hypothetical protein
MIHDGFWDLHELEIFSNGLLEGIYRCKLPLRNHIFVWMHGGVCIGAQVNLKGVDLKYFLTVLRSTSRGYESPAFLERWYSSCSYDSKKIK